ncbi:hypothetical protein GCM10010172_76670 [Paractinoplanes ferrugineus]|uniref:Uncharacterized protein n=1 Tax=Paractinoplanes ferrugineus TaxID=113564 RepID=A0A919ML39_9ACTN|nr:hypothetical protein [Actinoplanes ferrugineus]GIE16425.1 hypothetical protein Afe05nite_82650 [Actinoplanes ferrugineus]
MDVFEARCHLDWWANSATRLASVAVLVVITPIEAGWAGAGHLSGADDDIREGFAFLCELDPVFTLGFDDGSECAVTVHRGEGDNFSLTEYVGPPTRPVEYETQTR